MSSSSVWAFKGIAGEFEGNTLPLKPPMMTIGRTGENHVVIMDNNVSRRHAVIYVTQHSIQIQDEKSRNGVILNEQKIEAGKKIALKHGDRIQIGPHAFIIELDDKARNLTKVTETKKMPKDPKQEAAPLEQNSFFSKSANGDMFNADKFSKFKLNRRTLIYGVLGTFILMVVVTQMFPTQNAEKKKPEKTGTNVEIQSMDKGPATPMTSDELDSLKARAKASLQFQDYLAATELYEKITKAQPLDEFSKTQFEFSKKQLKRLIERHLEFAKREYEKLNYERAIIEWKQALALTNRSDPEVYKQTEEKIKDAEKEIRKRR